MPRLKMPARKNAPLDPVAQFNRWFQDEVAARTELPEAMALATAGRDAKPSVRFVLLKQADEYGFCFYTDVRSPKGRQLVENPYAAMVFYWARKGRQVRIDGGVEQMTAREADDYWVTRPLASRLSGTISQQSQPIGSREELVARVVELRRKLAGKPPPRPDYWLGFRVIAQQIEFWIRAPHRLHRRELFVRTASGWRRSLLQP
jgi:pyridoxamine 5'-phosphate oxidase